MLYVDDILVSRKNMLGVEELKEKLSKKFEMYDLGEAKKIL